MYREEFFVVLCPNKTEDLNISSVSGGVSNSSSGGAEKTLTLLDEPNIQR